MRTATMTAGRACAGEAATVATTTIRGQDAKRTAGGDARAEQERIAAQVSSRRFTPDAQREGQHAKTHSRPTRPRSAR